MHEHSPYYGKAIYTFILMIGSGTATCLQVVHDWLSIILILIGITSGVLNIYYAIKHNKFKKDQQKNNGAEQ